MDKLADICIYLSLHPHSSKEEVAAYICRSEETAKKFLQALSAMEMITPEGGNKNRTYSGAGVKFRGWPRVSDATPHVWFMVSYLTQKGQSAHSPCWA